MAVPGVHPAGIPLHWIYPFFSRKLTFIELIKNPKTSAVAKLIKIDFAKIARLAFFIVLFFIKK